MKSQLAVQDKKKGTVLPASSFLQHVAVRPIADHTAQPELASALSVSRFGRDFNQVAAHSEPIAARPPTTQHCPVTPTRWPFGGACHTCPVPVQADLAMNQPGDEYEQEADRVAEQLMREPGAQLQRRAASRVQTVNVPSIVHDVLSSPGQPLDAATRALMESRFGYDFSRVRVHTDSKAAESARAVSALAYTVGQDVVFGVGQHRPHTTEGQRLMAHELTHVVQQSGNRWIPRSTLPAVSDPLPSAHDMGSRRLGHPGVWPLLQSNTQEPNVLTSNLLTTTPKGVLQRATAPLDPDCEDLLTQIVARLVELKERADALIRNPLNLPQSGPMSIEGHQQQFRNKQTNMRRKLQQWDTNNCGPGYIPSDAWQWATRPVPAPAPSPSASPRTTEAPRDGSKITTSDVVTAVGVGAGAVATGYIVYRVIRFLPSLLPPLWWTIPANVAVP
jgi:hypothetical protein